MSVAQALRLRSRLALPYHFVIIPVFMLAVLLRLAPLGEQYMDGDHAYISMRALHIAHYGDRPLLGPPMAIDLWHSPLSVYLFAIPYRFSLNTLVARAFSAGMGIVTVGLIYGFGLNNPVTGERLTVTRADGITATNDWANLQVLIIE